MIKRAFILLLLLAVSGTLQAQRFNKAQIYDGLRYHKWEVSLLTQYQNSTGEDGAEGESLDIEDTWGFGFTIGWNMTEKWNFAYKLTINKPNYSAVVVPEDPEFPPQTINYKMSKYAHQFNATYHFMKGPLTPYIQAGAGWMTLDSNIIDRPPVIRGLAVSPRRACTPATRSASRPRPSTRTTSTSRSSTSGS